MHFRNSSKVIFAPKLTLCKSRPGNHRSHSTFFLGDVGSETVFRVKWQMEKNGSGTKHYVKGL